MGPNGSRFCLAARENIRTPEFDKSATPIWTHEVRPEGVRAEGPNQSLRARQMTKGVNRSHGLHLVPDTWLTLCTEWTVMGRLARRIARLAIFNKDL